MRAFAPMIGYAIGAWTNSLYVDLSGNFTAAFRKFKVLPSYLTFAQCNLETSRIAKNASADPTQTTAATVHALLHSMPQTPHW